MLGHNSYANMVPSTYVNHTNASRMGSRTVWTDAIIWERTCNWTEGNRMVDIRVGVMVPFDDVFRNGWTIAVHSVKNLSSDDGTRGQRVLQSAIPVPDMSLSTFRSVSWTPVSTITIDRRLCERGWDDGGHYADCPSPLHTARHDCISAWSIPPAISQIGNDQRWVLLEFEPRWPTKTYVETPRTVEGYSADCLPPHSQQTGVMIWGTILFGSYPWHTYSVTW